MQTPHGTRQLRSAIDGHLIAGYGIDSDLTTEEQLILVTDVEVKDSCILQEELALLGNEDRERSQVELF